MRTLCSILWITYSFYAQSFAFQTTVDSSFSNFDTYAKLIGTKEIYTIEDGLASDWIFNIIEDKDGFIWITTSHGVSRFDGTSFKNYHYSTDKKRIELKHTFITQYDKEKNAFWHLTTNGLFFHNIYEETIEQILIWDEKNKSHFSNIGSLLVDQNKIWFSANHKALYSYEIDSKELVHYPILLNDWRYNPIPESTRFILKDPSNESLLWMTTNACLMSFDTRNQEFIQYPYLQDDEYSAVENIYEKIYFFQGKIYCISYARRIVVFDPKEEKFNKLLLQNQPYYSIFGFSIINDNIHISTDLGLFVLNNEHQQIFQDSVSNSIHLKDSRGIYWGSNYKKNLSKFDPIASQLNFIRFPDRKESKHNIIPRDFLVKDEFLFVPTLDGSGLYGYNLNSQVISPIKTENIKGQNTPRVQAGALLDEDHLLLINEDRLYTMDMKDKRIHMHPYQFPNYQAKIRDIILDKNKLWYGGRLGGFGYLDLSNGQIKEYNSQLLQKGDKNTGWIEKLHKYNNDKIWISRGDNKRYSYLDLKTDSIWNAFDSDSINTFSKSHDFIEDTRGRMWISSEYGLGIINNNMGVEIIDPRYFNELASFENYIIAIGSHKIHMVDIHSHEITTIHPNYGKIDEVISGPIEVINDTTVAVGCYNGFFLFNPQSFSHHEESPVPYLKEIKLDGIFFRQSTSSHSDNVVNLPQGTDFMSFKIGAQAYRLPRLALKYRLNNSTWKNTSIKKELNISNLNAGSHELEVSIRNVTQQRHPWISRKIKIYIEPYWYETNWFKGLLAFLVFTLLGLLYRWRINTIRHVGQFESKINDMRISALQSQMNPHFIFNCLNTVDGFIATNNQNLASNYLGNFAHLLRRVLHNSREDLVTLESELLLIRNYIELEKARINAGFNYLENIENAALLKEYKIPPFLLQPFVENAIWHGLNNGYSNPTLEINQNFKEGKIYIYIIDNGPGIGKRSYNKTSNSLGIKITEERIAFINKKYPLNIKILINDRSSLNSDNKGTQVEISFNMLSS